MDRKVRRKASRINRTIFLVIFHHIVSWKEDTRRQERKYFTQKVGVGAEAGAGKREN